MPGGPGISAPRSDIIPDMSRNRMSRRAVQVVAENRIREAIEEGLFDDQWKSGKLILHRRRQ